MSIYFIFIFCSFFCPFFLLQHYSSCDIIQYIDISIGYKGDSAVYSLSILYCSNKDLRNGIKNGSTVAAANPCAEVYGTVFLPDEWKCEFHQLSNAFWMKKNIICPITATTRPTITCAIFSFPPFRNIYTKHRKASYMA